MLSQKRKTNKAENLVHLLHHNATAAVYTGIWEVKKTLSLLTYSYILLNYSCSCHGHPSHPQGTFNCGQSLYLSRISRFISVEKKLSCGEISLDHFFRTLTEIRPAVFKRGVSALLAIHLLVNSKFYVYSESNQQKLIAKYRSCSRHKFKRHIQVFFIGFRTKCLFINHHVEIASKCLPQLIRSKTTCSSSGFPSSLTRVVRR